MTMFYYRGANCLVANTWKMGKDYRIVSDKLYVTKSAESNLSPSAFGKMPDRRRQQLNGSSQYVSKQKRLPSIAIRESAKM